MHLLIYKILLGAAICIAVNNNILAQSYTNSPGDSLMQNTALEHTVVMNITQLHPTNDTLIFKWRKVKALIPAAWAAQICDNGSCYTSVIDSGMMIPIVPGDNGLMSIHCTPHTTPGTAVIRYLLYAANTPTRIDTLTWIINATATDIENSNRVLPFIYALNGQIYFHNIPSNYTEIKIYTLDGREIFASPVIEQLLLPYTNSQTVIVVLKGANQLFSQKILLR